MVPMTPYNQSGIALVAFMGSIDNCIDVGLSKLYNPNTTTYPSIYFIFSSVTSSF